MADHFFSYWDRITIKDEKKEPSVPLSVPLLHTLWLCFISDRSEMYIYKEVGECLDIPSDYLTDPYPSDTYLSIFLACM